MLVRIYEENPNQKEIDNIVSILSKGGLVIYPTDTIYAIGCDLLNSKGLEAISKIKGVKPEKANFSLICYDLSHISDFTKPLDNSTFKLMKRVLPGPFTFILNASNSVPRIFKSKRKTIGIRIPDNNIARTIVKELGRPLVTSSIHDDDEIIEYTTDPELIHEKYKDKVEVVINGGYGTNIASTIVDCTQNEPEIIRQGVGILWDD